MCLRAYRSLGTGGREQLNPARHWNTCAILVGSALPSHGEVIGSIPIAPTI
jgi:hypothetical protein